MPTVPEEADAVVWTGFKSTAILAGIQSVIAAAHHTLLLASYSFTGMREKPTLLLNALADARKRGVQVEMLLRDRSRDLPEIAALLDIGVEVRANRENHAKYAIADGDHGLLFSANFDGVHGLSVPRIAAAHGCELIERGLPIKNLVPLSRYLLAHPDEEQAAWKATLSKGGAFASLGTQPSAQKWARVPSIDFTLPPTVRELAVDAGIIEATGDKARIRCDEREALEALKRDALPWNEKWRLIGTMQARVNFFGGGWWEVAVANAAIESGAFRDVRWSAELAKHGQRELEEDVLAVQGTQLAYFSCKRGDPKRLMRQLEEMDASARRIGGRMARKYFCVCHLNGRINEDVHRRAEQLHIHVVTDAEIEKFGISSLASLNEKATQ